MQEKEDYRDDIFYCYSLRINHELKEMGIRSFFNGFTLKGVPIKLYRKTERLLKILEGFDSTYWESN